MGLGYIGLPTACLLYTSDVRSVRPGSECFPILPCMLSRPLAETWAHCYISKLKCPDNPCLLYTSWVDKAKRAVFSVVTYDQNDKILNTGNGFFVTEDGVALSDYTLFKGRCV